MRDRSEFGNEQAYRNHLEHEVNAARGRGDQKALEEAEKELAKLDGGEKKTTRPRSSAAKEQR